MFRLRDLGDWSGGNTPSKANTAYWTNGTVPWVSPKDMKVDEITTSEDRITETALNEGRVSLVPEGSILFVTRSGILAHTLPVAITKLPVTINQDLKALTPRPGVSPKYVAHAMRGASRRILDQCSKHGTTVASIETNALLDFEIPLVDLDEQHGIVAEIEKQFSRLDEAVANLKRIKSSLARYQAAVLNQLTSGAGRYASLDERGVANGRDEMQALGVVMPRLPAGWIWATVGAVGSVKGGKRLPAGHTYAVGRTTRPYLRVTDFARFGIDDSALQFLSEATHRAIERYTISARDVYISIAGSIGLVGQVPAHLDKANLTENAAKITGLQDVEPRFLVYWLASPIGRTLIAKSTIATTQAKLALFRIERLPIPLPSIDEQRRIVAEVDRRLSIVREVEAEVDASLKRAQALRQAVLAKAFGANSAEQPRQGEQRPPLKLIPGTTNLADSVRAAISAEVVHRLHREPTFGQVKHQKVVYLVEHIACIESMQTRYRREKFGPVNLQVLEANERILEQQAWYAHRRREESGGHRYVPMTKAGGHTEYLTVLPPDQLARVRDLIALVRDWDTDRCERFATMYAAWNDLILLHKPVTPDAVLSEILDWWDEGKERFTRAQWLDTMQWIERNGFSPTGFGQPTRPEIAGVTGSLFGGHSV